jgi:hypothetical protein
MPVKPPIQAPTSDQEQPSFVTAEYLAELLITLESVIPASDAGSLLNEREALIQIIDQVVKAAPQPGDVPTLISHHLQIQGMQLTPALKVRLLFWQTLFTAIEEACQLDIALKVELQRLRPVFLQTGLADDFFAINPQHLMHQFFSRLLTEGSYWYANSGKENAQFFDAVVQAVNEIVAAAGADSVGVNTTIETFFALLDKQNARAQMMAQRCGESELGMAKIHRVQAQVVVLLDSLVGCALPESILNFLRVTLKSELQFILINDGDAAIAWQSWSAIIKRLPQVFPVLIPDAEKPVEPEPPNLQQLYRDVQIIVGLLDEHVTVSAANQQIYDEGVADLRECLFNRLRGTPEKLVRFESIATLDELSQLGAAVSPALLKRVAHLRIDDWFMFFNSDDQWLRCKLLLLPPQTEQLIFVNRSGHRVLQKSVRDFSACLAAHVAKPLIVADTLTLALARTCKKLQLLCEKNKAMHKNNKASPGATAGKDVLLADNNAISKSEVADMPVISSAQENASVNAELLASSALTSIPRSRASDVSSFDDPQVSKTDSAHPAATPANDRKSAAEKALQEARVLERLAIRRERQRSRLETTIDPENVVAEESASEQAQAAVDLLNIGAWVELPVANIEPQRCKLVAIMRSTNTFIFADRRGVKVAELQRDHLINLLAEQRAQILSRGDDFEGQLSKVVLTLRRDL